jgi:hypothetical protein
MAQDQVALQNRSILGRDLMAGQLPEPGVDAIDGYVALGGVLNAL